MVGDCRRRRNRRGRTSLAYHEAGSLACASPAIGLTTQPFVRYDAQFVCLGTKIVETASVYDPLGTRDPCGVLLRPEHPGVLWLAPVRDGVLVQALRRPRARAAAATRPVAGRDDPAPHLQRDVRRGPPDRRGLPDGLSQGVDGDPGPGRLHRRDRRRRRPRGPSLAAPGIQHQLSAPHRPHRLQGRRARGGHAGRRGPLHRDLRRRLRAAGRLPAPGAAAVRRSAGRDGAGPLGPHQRRLLDADAHPVDHAGRPLRAGARQPQPRRLLLQFQRHGRASGAATPSSRRAAGSTTPSPRTST